MSTSFQITMAKASDDKSVILENNSALDEKNGLFHATYFARLKLLRLLVDGGSDINISNGDGQTPLMTALLSKYTDEYCAPKEILIRYILEHGGDCNKKDRQGKSALVLAIQNNLHQKVIKMLLDFGADPTLSDRYGMCSLLYAANANDSSMLQLLKNTCKARGKDVKIQIIPTETTNKVKNEKPDAYVPVAEAERHQKWGENTEYHKLISEDKNEEEELDKVSNISISIPESKETISEPKKREMTIKKPINSCRDGAITMEVNESRKVSKTFTGEKLKLAPHLRQLKRRNTTEVLMINPQKEHLTNFDSLEELANAHLESIKASLLQWEKELSNRTSNIDPYVNKGRRGSMPFCDGLKAVLPNNNNLTSQEDLGQTKWKGSRPKLLDHISVTRPGTLPPLNQSTKPPIPGIGKKTHSLSDLNTGISGSPLNSPHNENKTTYTTVPRKPHPNQRFFEKRSQTVQNLDIDRHKSFLDQAAYSIPENELQAIARKS